MRLTQLPLLLLVFCLLSCQKSRESTIELINEEYKLSYSDNSLNIKSNSQNSISPCRVLKCDKFSQLKFFIDSKSIHFDEYLEENNETTNLYFDHEKEIYIEEFLLNEYLIEYSSSRDHTEFLIINPLKYIEVKDIISEKIAEDIKSYETRITLDEYIDDDKTFDITSIHLDESFSKRIILELRGDRIQKIFAIF